MAFLRTLVGVLTCATVFAADTTTLTYGHYEGTLRPRGLAYGIFTSLDLFVGQEADRAARVYAIVKMKTGKKGEGESVTYFFPEVPFSYEDSVLSLDGSPMRMFLKTSAKRLEGKFDLSSDGSTGAVELDLVGAFPNVPHGHELGKPKETEKQNELENLVRKLGEGEANRRLPDLLPALSGDYYGKCGEDPTLLHVESFRGLGTEPESSQDSLLNYEIQASLGRQDCPDEVKRRNKEAYCTTSFFNSGHYHFASGQLRLKGIQGSLRCHLEKDEWRCENNTVNAKQRLCVFAAPESRPYVENEPLHATWLKAYRAHMERVLENDVAPLPATPAAQDINGDYLGYLFLQDRGRAQLARLKLLSANATRNSHTPESLFLMPSLSLFLGPPTAREIMTQPFDRRPFLNTMPHLLFSGDNDGILQVTSWSRGIVEGLWFSKSYGLVGPVVLMRGRMPMLSRDIVPLQALTGTYRNKTFTLRLDVGLQQSSPKDPAWLVEGSFNSNDGSFVTQLVEKANYQPYDGDIFLQVEKPGNDRARKIVSGRVNADGNLSIVAPHIRTSGMEIPKYEPILLTRDPEPKE